jgi:hypothetical protein
MKSKDFFISLLCIFFYVTINSHQMIRYSESRISEMFLLKTVYYSSANIKKKINNEEKRINCSGRIEYKSVKEVNIYHFKKESEICTTFFS